MENQYISLDDVAEQLDVAQGTVQYYLKVLNILRYKFPLDRKAYITEADFARILLAKEQAGKRGKKEFPARRAAKKEEPQPAGV